jgi:hypothetical protein
MKDTLRLGMVPGVWAGAAVSRALVRDLLAMRTFMSFEPFAPDSNRTARKEDRAASGRMRPITARTSRQLQVDARALSRDSNRLGGGRVADAEDPSTDQVHLYRA